MTNRENRKIEVIEGVNSKVHELFIELMNKKTLDKLTYIEKTKIFSLINELKYNTRQLKNIITI